MLGRDHRHNDPPSSLGPNPLPLESVAEGRRLWALGDPFGPEPEGSTRRSTPPKGGWSRRNRRLRRGPASRRLFHSTHPPGLRSGPRRRYTEKKHSHLFLGNQTPLSFTNTAFSPDRPKSLVSPGSPVLPLSEPVHLGRVGPELVESFDPDPTRATSPQTTGAARSGDVPLGAIRPAPEGISTVTTSRTEEVHPDGRVVVSSPPDWPSVSWTVDPSNTRSGPGYWSRPHLRGVPSPETDGARRNRCFILRRRFDLPRLATDLEGGLESPSVLSGAFHQGHPGGALGT